MKTARQRILVHIQANKAVTSSELCQSLKTTEANVRHHLGILLEQGLVQVIGERQPPGKGRPARVYGISAQSLGSNLDLLAAALFETILPALSLEEKRLFLESLAERIEAAMPGGTSSVGPSRTSERPAARLVSAVQRLNAAHYQARWEARPDGPRLILGHCPFAAINQQHPEICQVDAYIIERLTGSPVEQMRRLAKDARGATYCLFRLIPSP